MNRVRANVTIEAEEVIQYRVNCSDCGSSLTTGDQESVGWWIMEHAHKIQPCCNCDSAEEQAGYHSEGPEGPMCGCECHDGVEQLQEAPEQTETVDSLEN